MKKRDYNIDFLRGIATLWIIVIHTAWWSGTGYLPSWFSNLTLLLDVPVFMFISGVSFNYVNSIIKNLKGIIVQWKKWIYFLIFYTLILIIFFKEQFILKDIFSWIVYVFPHPNNIEVVAGSIWFMIMYIKVTIFCSIIICVVNYFFKKESLKNLLTISGVLLIIFLYCSNNKNFLFLDSYLSFYSLIYLLGYILHHYKIKSLKQLLILEGLDLGMIVITFTILKLNITSIQEIKFPPSMPYLFVSLQSILLFWYLKDNLKIKESNKINYIGKNAIVFYFVQGISSSFIYYVYKVIPFTNPVPIFLIMLTTNIFCTIIGATFLNKTYELLTEKLSWQHVKNIILPVNKDKKVV